MPEKLFRILLLLLQANGRVVEKETFFSRVWPEESVSDGNLAQHVFLLRKLLGDEESAHPYILTVPRKGYRFAQRSSAVVRSDIDVLSENAANLGGVLLDDRFEAFNSYCKASHFLERRTATDLKKALTLFKASLDLDPDYTPAWVGLSRAQALLGEFAYVAPLQAFPQALQAVEKALELDAASETAHALLSEIRMFGDWDFAGAESSLTIALDLNPQSLFVRHNIAWFHICRGAFDRAVVEAEQALLLEPASMVFLLILGRALMFRGELSPAIACYSNVIESAPDDVWARTMRAIAFIFFERPQLAIDDLRRLPRNGPEIPLLARALVDAGNPEAASKILDDLLELSKTQYVPHWDFAVAFAALEQQNSALEQLDLSMKAREPLMLLLPGLSKLFGSAQNDLRFKRLLKLLPNHSM
ncbi:MAG: winged helix-turn-helix domain-containing protein [Candidatus Eremiobacteraeota bacterium]|nr:winged helix-turn-helix domain-containing protein [Candidatus Eremiobacteraeota bacterium]